MIFELERRLNTDKEREKNSGCVLSKCLQAAREPDPNFEQSGSNYSFSGASIQRETRGPPAKVSGDQIGHIASSSAKSKLLMLTFCEAGLTHTPTYTQTLRDDALRGLIQSVGVLPACTP